MAVGDFGTNVEIVEEEHGQVSLGEMRLALGREFLGRIMDPGSRSSLKMAIPWSGLPSVEIRPYVCHAYFSD